jgi:hypothetical protein
VRLRPETILAVLRHDGFYGQLNWLRDFVPNLVLEARRAARRFERSASTLVDDAGA